VTFQDPSPGATIKKGRDVIIYISKGFKESRVPDLRQVELKQGLLTLEANELRPGRILYVYSDQTRKQGIISQYPLPRTPASADTPCDLLVSKGPRPLARIMPDLVKLSIDQAAARIENLSLALGEIRSKSYPNHPQGQVIEQTPPFGSRVLAGTGVSLVVNHSAQKKLTPQALKNPVWLSFTLPHGFSNRHVRLVTDIFGTQTDAFNGFMKPGKNINLLIPGGIKTKIRFFVDHRLKIIREIDPWRQSTRLPWVYSAPNTFIGKPFTGEYQ